MKKLICTIMNLKNITSRLIATVFLLVGCVLTLNATRNGLTASTPVGFCAKKHDGWSFATIMMMTPICGATAAPRGTVASPRATDLRPPPPPFLSLSFSLPRRIAEWQGKTTSRRWRFQRSPSRMWPHSPSALPRHRRAGSQIRIRGPIP